MTLSTIALLETGASARPWWWAQFTLGDGVNNTNSGFERWEAFVANQGNPNADTTYVCSYTWGSGQIGTIDGINAGNTAGLNKHSAAGYPADYLIGDGDGGVNLTNAQTLSDAAVTDVTEPAGGDIMHIKDIFVENRGYLVSSANMTAGGFRSQHNNAIWFPWAGMSAGMRAKVRDQMVEMAGGTFHDATQYGTIDFTSPNGDRIELRYAPEDNDGGSGAGAGSILSRYRQLVAGTTQSIFFMSDAWSASVGTNALRDDIIAKAGIIWRGCAGAGTDWDATTQSNFEGDANGTLRNQSGAFNRLHSKTFIFDMDTVATGSANMTATAMYSPSTSNDEVSVIVHDFRLARRYMTHYWQVMDSATADPSADAFDKTAPAGASGLAVSATDTAFYPSWTASATADVVRYYLFIDTAAFTQAKVGDRLDQDGDGYYDEDPPGDYDGFMSGSTAADSKARDDDADGTADEDSWFPPEVRVNGRASTAGAITSWNVGDSLLAATNYYFAIVSVDTQGNEGAIAVAGPVQLSSGGVDTTIPNAWYVNDTSTAGDSFTTAIGYDTNSGLTPAAPKRTLAAVDHLLTAGDTVYVDSGWYYEADTITIDTNSIWVLGVDSRTTTVHFNNQTNTGARCIYARNAARLTIRDLAVVRAQCGIRWLNVDSSVLQRVRTESTGANSFPFVGAAGIFLETGSSQNILSNCRVTGAQTWGVLLLAGNDNVFRDNLAESSGCGFELGVSDSNILQGNISRSNTSTLGGFFLWNGCDGNVLSNNLSVNNSSYGYEDSGGRGNRFHQNTADSNASWAVYLHEGASSDTFEKNIFLASAYAPNSGVLNATPNRHFLSRNWWGTTDSSLIRQRLKPDTNFGIPGGDSIRYMPFRLGIVDTSLAGDSVAPRAPDTVAAVATGSMTATVSWAAVALDEETDGYATNLAGYRVWRSRTPDTSLWVQAATAGAATTQVVDSGLLGGETYYWRLTAFDAWSTENQSFFSDSIAAATTLESTPPSAFQLLAPAEGLETSVFPLAFSWTAAADSNPPVTYAVRRSTQASFLSYVESAVGANTSAAVAVVGTETWWWRVIATDAAGNTRACMADSRILVDTMPPAVFALLAPAAGAETSATAIAFSWSASSDTQSGLAGYVFQVSTQASFASTLIDSATGLSTSTAAVLPANDTYVWRVVAVDDLGNTRAAAASTLVVDTGPPSAFALQTPSADTGFATPSVAFTWAAAADTRSGLNRYRIQVSMAASFAALKVDSSTGTTASTTLALPLNDTYWWRVVAYDDAGNAETSIPAARMLFVETVPPTAFALLDPAAAHETSASSIRLDWADASDTISGLERYEVQISTSASFATVFSTSWIRASESAAVFPSADTWWWRVTAVDTAGNRRMATETRSILVDSTPPVLLTVAVASSAAPFFFDSGPIDTAPAGDTVWFQPDSAPGQACTVTVTFADARPGTFAASPAFGDAPSADASSPFQAVYTIEAGASETAVLLAVFDKSGSSDTTLLRFAPDTTPPSPTVRIAPADSAAQGNTDVAFSWQASADSQAGLARYLVQASTDPAFSLRAVDSTTVATSLAAVLPSGSWWWRVVAYDSVGNANTAAASPPGYLRIDATFPVVTRVTLASSVSPFDESAPVGVTDVGDTVWFGPRAQVCTLTVTVTDDNDSQVAGDTKYVPVDILDLRDGDSLYVLTYALDAAASDSVVWIVATDANGNQDTVPVFFGRDSEPPVAVALAAPAAGLETSTTSFAFAWSATTDTRSGVAAYRFQASTSPAFASLAIDSSTGLAASTTLALPANDTWYWRVLAVDDVGNTSPVAETRSLLVDAASPAAFAPLSPAADAETTATTVTFTWSASTDTGSGLNRYRILVATIPTFAYARVDSSTGLTASTTLALPANDTYWWRVVAYDDVGNTRSGGDVRLAVDTAGPGAFALAGPATGVETSAVPVAFSWGAASDSIAGLNRYQLQASTSSTFASLAADSATGTTAGGALPLPTSDTYWWRVVAYDDLGNTTLSNETRVLVVDRAAPAAFALLSPIAGANTAAFMVFLDWADAVDTLSGLATYRVQVASDSTFSAPVRDGWQGPTSDTSVLLASGSYWWRVWAIDDVGNSAAASNAPETFNTALSDSTSPTPFSLIAPADSLVTAVPFQAFSWNASSDTGTWIADYRFQASKDSGFAVLAADSSVGTTPNTGLALPANETWYWRVVAYDFAGNTALSTPTRRRIVLDTMPPTPPALLDPTAAETVLSPVVLRWGASTETGSGLASYRVQVSTLSTFSYLSAAETRTLAGDTDVQEAFAAETYWWRVVATDSAGNAETSTADSFQVRGTETTAPTVTSPATSDAVVTNGGGDTTLFTVTATDTSGVATVVIDLGMLGGSPAQPLYDTGPGSGDTTAADGLWNLDYAVPDSAMGGTYDLVVTVTDAAGNTTTAMITITVTDATPDPYAEILAPASTVVVEGGAGRALTVLVGPDTTLTRVVFEVRASPGGAWTYAGADSTGPVFGLTLNLGGAPLGDYYVRAIGYRAATGDSSPSYVLARVVAAGSAGIDLREVLVTGDVEATALAPNESATLASQFPAIDDVGTMYVPAGARTVASTYRIARRTAMSLGESTAIAADRLTAVGSIFDCEVDGVAAPVFGSESPVTVAIFYDHLDTDAEDDALGDSDAREVDVRLYYYDVAMGRWLPVAGQERDAALNVVWADVTHFTAFTLFVRAGTATLDGVRIYPNPWVPSDGDAANGVPYTGAVGTGITFDNVPPNTSIEIFDVAGKSIATIPVGAGAGSYDVVWDVRNDSGRDVASGMYLVVLRSGSSVVTRKVMVVR